MSAMMAPFDCRQVFPSDLLAGNDGSPALRISYPALTHRRRFSKRRTCRSTCADGRPYDLLVSKDRPGAITWIGHASVLVELAGIRLLTDPALTPRLAHLRRHHPVDLGTVGTPDAVLISHVHADHLHLPSLRLLGHDVTLIVPSGAGDFVRRHGFRNVREVGVGDTEAIGGVTVTAVPAVHDARRGPHSRLEATPLGYVLRGPFAVYFAGDTDLFPAMADLRADVALLPIWGWGRTLGPGHLDPVTAVRAMELLRPSVVVPIHWGTFSPVSVRGAPAWLRRPLQQFEAELARAGATDRLRALAPGESLVLNSNQLRASA
jgi:L-ascorbate metabolism protein UlaG (beta-lactamase superfamily)